MKQLVLTKEQMKYLEELGLDTSDASMQYVTIQEDDAYSGNPIVIREIVPIDFEGCCHTFKSFAYTLQDVLEHLTPAHQQMVLRYVSDLWLEVAYEKLVFQLTHKEDFK